jgi:thiol-disulfide isomerase/thioredoxin
MTNLRLLGKLEFRFWTPFRIGSTFAVLGLLAALGFSGCRREPEANVNSIAKAPQPEKSKPANGPALAYDPAVFINMPDSLRDAELPTIGGKTIKLADYTGKVVILNLWATWCGPCREETPELIDLSKEYKDKGVQFIGIATKENESQNGIEGVKLFARGYQVPYEMVFTDGNFAGPLVQLVHGPASIPQSWVISRSGKFVAHFSGFNPTVTPSKLKAVIDQAVTESPAG